MLDAVFARAPIGLALYDRDLRLLRINDHLAEINGMPAAEQIGRPVSEIVPDIEGVVPRMRQVLETGRGLSQIEVEGSTRAAPGRAARVRGLLLAGPPPRHRRDARRRLRGHRGHRAPRRRPRPARADRALRVAAARPLRGRRGHDRARGRAARLRQPGLPRLLRLLDRGAAWRCRRCSTSSRTTSATTPGAVRSCGSRASATPATSSRCVRRDGHRVPLEIAGVPLEIGGRTQMVIVGRDVTARARAEAEREWLLERSAFLAEASASFDAVLDEERIFDALARLSVRDLADTCVILLGSPGRIRRIACVARDPTDERMLHELVERYPFADRRSHPLLDVLSTGRSRLVEHPEGPDFPAAGRAPPRADRALQRQEHRDRAAAGARAHARRDGARLRRRRRRGPRRAVRGPRAPRRARDRQRAPVRGARQRRAHAPALAAAAGAPRRARASSSRRATSRPARATRSAATSTTASAPATASGRS